MQCYRVGVWAPRYGPAPWLGCRPSSGHPWHGTGPDGGSDCAGNLQAWSPPTARELTIPAQPALQPQALPPGAEALTVRLGGIAVEGGLPEFQRATAAITDPLVGQVVTAAEVFEAARAVNQLYADAGLVLVRVTVPPQNVVNGGTLRLLVINGMIERIDTSKVPEVVRARVDRMLAPLIGEAGLRLPVIERRLLLAGDMPGIALRSTLVPGETVGGAVLVVEGRHDMVTGSLSFDNNFAPELGRTALGLGMDVNSPTGSGEQVYLRANGWFGSLGSGSFFDEYPRNRVLAAGIVVPIGINGTTLNFEVTDAHTTPKPKSGNPQTASSFSRYALRLRYPLIRSRSSTLNVEASFDAQDQVNDIISPANLSLAHDELRVFRLASDGFLVTDLGGLLTGRIAGSAGVDALGARNVDAQAAVPLSRQGVDPEFQKVDLALRYQQPLGNFVAVQVEGRGQSSFGRPLPLSEQIILASSGGLSTFYSGTIAGDSGYVLRSELQFQRQFPFFETNVAMGLSPYLFAAAGEVFLSEPTAVERRHTSATSYGLGLRWGAMRDAWRSNLSVALEYGRRDSSSLRQTEDLFTINVLLRF